MRGEAILKMNVVITPTKEIRNRILTDLEFDVFQGALSRAHAQHSCKLMRQASCDKIRRKPFAWSEEYPYGVRSQRESNSKSWSFCELFGSSPTIGQKVGDKNKCEWIQNDVKSQGFGLDSKWITQKWKFILWRISNLGRETKKIFFHWLSQCGNIQVIRSLC